MLKKAGNIYSKDMKTIVTNWVVAVLIGGLVILPSLYAWLNIKASWDPYGQTDQIPIGVVNEDEGASVRDEAIDVGKKLEDILKENREMNWQFVNRDKAMQEVEYGNYFAVIIIPDDFSKELATVVSANPEKANIDYYVNEKINAIAPKITDKGVSVIVEEISSEFTSTVNGVIFNMFNNIGLELEQEQPDIEKFENYILDLEAELPGIHETLTSTDADAKEVKSLVQEALGKFPEAKSMTDKGSEALNTAMSYLEKSEQLFDKLSPKIKDEVSKAQVIIQNINETMENAKEHGGLKEKFNAKLNDQISKINQSQESLEPVKTTIEQLQQ